MGGHKGRHKGGHMRGQTGERVSEPVDLGDISKIEPVFWGPVVWRVLFIFALAYPLKNPNLTVKHQYKQFYLALSGVLPCPTCRDSVSKHGKTQPIDEYLDTRLDLIKWIVDLYNSKRPPDTQIRKIRDISKLVNPDDSCRKLLAELKEENPKYTF